MFDSTALRIFRDAHVPRVVHMAHDENGDDMRMNLLFKLNYPFDEKYINFMIYQFAQVSYRFIRFILLISLEIFLPIFISMYFSLSMLIRTN